MIASFNMPHKENKKEQSNDEIHSEAMKRFEIVEDRAQRQLSVEEMRFAHVEGAQWDENARGKRADRPRFTINRIEPAIDQIVGNQRQNRTSIKIRPVSGGADEKTATIFNGLVRNIESVSKAANAYDSAFDEAIAGGFGGWRILTEFNDDDVFEQDILIKPIKSAASSLYFGPSDEYDKRDAQYAFLITNFPPEEFKDKWPAATASGFTDNQISNSPNCTQWFREESIRVAEYWKKVPVTKRLGKLSDGRVIDLDEEEKVLDELRDKSITIIKERTVKSHKIVMYKVSGLEILEGPNEWAGKFIPLVPVFGKVHHIEDETFVKGIVRDAKDPQRIYNYETSQSIETSSLTPKDPYWMTKTMAAGLEDQLATFNKKNQPFMFYNADENHPGPPTRTGAPSVQQASLAMIQQASMDIEATTGIHAPALGRAPQLLSEKSVQSQSEKGDRGSFIYEDNLEKSKQYTGEICVDLIPRIYDTARTVRVLNIDGTSEQIEINKHLNQTIEDNQTGEKVIVNDLTQGKYDVVTDTAPSFATKRQESAAQLIELSASNPLVAELGLDIIARNLDINDADELHDRIRSRMIKTGTVEPTEDEIEELGLNEPQQPDPSQVALLENIQMSTQQMMADIENTEADTVSKQVKAQQEAAKTVDIMVKTMLEKVKLGVPLTSDEVQMIIAQRDILADSQDLLTQANSLPLLNPQQQ